MRIIELGLITFALVVSSALAQVPAFPGAEGSGMYALGGRGGDVYEVNDLNNSGAGSIVDALSAGNRTVVFRVSGTIDLDGVILEPPSYTTIAGQTAPGDGICIKGRFHIKNNAHDIIIRHVRVRVDEGAANSSGDAIDIDSGYNIIVDHVSASYARDETISCQEDSNNVTVQWCILSEALTFEGHSYGALVRGKYGQEKTYHHNLFIHNNGRNPRPGNYTDSSSDPEGLHFDFRNNVVYNWDGGHPGYNADVDSISRYNFVGNVFIEGVESSWTAAFKEDAVDAYAYWSGNAHGASYGSISVPSDQWDLVTFNGFNSSEIAAYKARSYEIPMESVTTTSASQALTDVLERAGASFPSRDIIDARLVNDVINDTGSSIETTDDQPEGAWPALGSLPAPNDTDHDGMPDTWETGNSLDPNDADDRNYYDLDADYTNLEVYLNSLVQTDDTAPSAPISLVATAYDGSVGLDWNDNNEPDLNGYNIYRSTTSGSGYIKLNTMLLSSPEYDDSGLTNTTTYYYVVTAVDTSFNESAYSDEVSATPRVYGDFVINNAVDFNDLAYLIALWLEDDCELTAEVDLGGDCIISFYEFSAFSLNWGLEVTDLIEPAAPSNLLATAGDATVSLDWDDNNESDLDGYNIYRSTTSGSYGDQLNGTLLSSSEYTDDTVVNGTMYYYVVTAVDTSQNESDDSVEACAVPDSGDSSITLQENATGFCGVDGPIESEHAGYTGYGYANTDNTSGNGVDYSIDILSAGTYTFMWRYANDSSNRPADLIINTSTEASGISFASTGAWTTWSTTTGVEVTLTAGTKTVRLEATGSEGLANIDYMHVAGPSPAVASCP